MNPLSPTSSNHDRIRHQETKHVKETAMKFGNERNRNRRLGRSAALLVALAVTALTCLGVGATSAMAAFGFETFDFKVANEDGTTATQAGSHPFSVTSVLSLNKHETEPGKFFPDEQLKDAFVAQVTGLVGDATAMPQCPTARFFTSKGTLARDCPDDTAVGQAAAAILNPFGWVGAPLYNLPPAPGEVARLAFAVVQVNIIIDVKVKQGGGYNVVAIARNTPEVATVFSSVLELWGDPSSPVHDKTRGTCGGKLSKFFFLSASEVGFKPGAASCPVKRGKPFLTLPQNCSGPETTTYEIDSWEHPSSYLPNGEPNLSAPGWISGGVETHNKSIPPEPQAFTGCSGLGFKPSITAEPTTRAAQSPTGLDFSLNVHDEGLANAEGLAQSSIKKAVVSLPEGMSANPSVAEGLGICTEADLERESLEAEPGEGCPNASKIGTVEVESPLVKENVNGSLFIAKPYENQFNSLLAMYIVIKNPKLGIIVKQAANVERDPSTGQLTTVVDDIPQLPFSRFHLHFREGARSPLVSPPSCGPHDVKAVLYPWSGTDPITTTSTFDIISGANNTACPKGGLPPFRPGLEAGTLNNAAGRFSPFYLRLSRNDGEQEMTHFSIKLPPGITGKLAGIPFCSDAAIQAAKERTGPLGGHEELEHPSCPAASEIGHTLAGAGVGSSLTYVPGKIYMAGPYHGAPLSMVAITAGVVGPFDVGTVVVRQAFRIDPETAEVFIDATGSDPIPHIIQGIPVDLRDIRAYVDKPEFVLNPTDCDRTQTASTVLGSGLDFASEADDNPITVSTPFQAADCAALPFGPKLTLRLLGGTKRGAHPRFQAHLKMNGFGEAAIQKAQVTLPHSEFLENAHIKTICTRVQFKAGAGNGAACPAASVYGFAKATTPILSEPLEGPVFLRSSEHQLPDLVAALHTQGGINFDLVGRIDSVKGGGIRNTFEAAPDAPVSEFTLTMQGGSKGLLVNSTDVCKGKHRARVDLTAHSGKIQNSKPALLAKCRKSHKRGSARRTLH